MATRKSWTPEVILINSHFNNIESYKKIIIFHKDLLFLHSTFFPWLPLPDNSN